MIALCYRQHIGNLQAFMSIDNNRLIDFMCEAVRFLCSHDGV